MEVALKDLTDTELYERQNKLISRMSMLANSGQQSTAAYNQCLNWMNDIEFEMFERANPDIGESGTVAIIGEPENETEEGKDTDG